jgi:hypothetical protein
MPYFSSFSKKKEILRGWYKFALYDNFLFYFGCKFQVQKFHAFLVAVNVLVLQNIFLFLTQKYNEAGLS